jgi:hypothetical protein
VEKELCIVGNKVESGWKKSCVWIKKEFLIVEVQILTSIFCSKPEILSVQLLKAQYLPL